MNNIPTFALSRERLKLAAPAIFAEYPAEHVSESYNFVPTFQILDNLEAAGWYPVAVSQAKNREEEKRQSSRHMVTFRNGDFKACKENLGKLLPVLRVINSHDWSSLVEVMAGMVRLVCTNGLFVAGPNFSKFSVRHNRVKDDILSAISQMADRTNLMLETASRWSARMLADMERRDFASKVIDLRFADLPNRPTVETMLLPHRAEDVGNDLWRTFNTVQENAIKGGHKGSLNRRIRSLDNIPRLKEVNEAIWELAETYS